MSVKQPQTGWILNPHSLNVDQNHPSNPRHGRPGYQQRFDSRQAQGCVSLKKGPQKRKFIMVGPTHPEGTVGAGVGKDRENYWRDASTWVPNESRMRSKGCKRTYERQGS